ncbi:hypothetical protein [Streptomyces sp. Je 1-332]|uniref:hypothetical protein n=1 Tax=Streptomyces sp. Je 1-332 TaxID=3231270 RepID=UPI0034576D05
MTRNLRDAGISRSSIHDAFSSPRLPRWRVVDALIEILSSMAPVVIAEQQLEPMHALWMRAATAGQRPATSSAPITTAPVSRTLLLLDIAQYSDRDDVEQRHLRRTLYGIVDRVLTASGIDETQHQRADRGDSVMELIAAEASLIALLRTLLTEVPVQLRAVNRMTASSAQIRLRVVLSTGHVAVDELDGWIGSDLNRACRLLDAEFLRTASRERDDGFALCVSDSVYDGTVRPGHSGISLEDFHRVAFDSKDGPSTAWLTGPA